MVTREALVRRVVHALIGLAPLYYLLPVEIEPLGVRRWMLLVAFLCVIIAFESVRLAMGWKFFGLRPHETKQIASFAWAAAGITATLWLFPIEVATAALVGMALVDPLAGVLRGTGVRDKVTLSSCSVAYFAVALPPLALLGDLAFMGSMAAAAVGAALAIPSEWFDVPYVDDDFLMLVIPAIGMTALTLAL
jgi:dolichol kinase